MSIFHGILHLLDPTAPRGRIGVSSEPDKGSTFTVYLPKLPGEKSRDSTDEGGSIPRGHERILFIDDEEDLAAMADEMLTDLGCRITAKCGAKEALVLFRLDPSRFDLVITDQAMPGMSAADTCQGDPLSQGRTCPSSWLRSASFSFNTKLSWPSGID
jgi:hypothetical protein